MQEPKNNDLVPSNLSFESLKKLNEHGIEYWSARDLQPYLGYSKWQRFENAIEKAKESCKQSGNNPEHHFTGAGKQIEFGIFHDAGYKGLYGGLGVDAIKARKGIDSKEQLMDRMETTELIANQFRMSQTREKLKRDYIKNQRDAIETHEAVGKEVRAAIAKIGGTPPENIPPAEHIKNVKKRLKTSKPRQLLKSKDTVDLKEVFIIKKRAITLLEIMIVILLIGLIGGVVSYNLKGTLDKGKAFRTEQGMTKLEDILNLELQIGNANIHDLQGKTDVNEEKIVECVQKSGLISNKEVKKFIRDGWGNPYLIKKVRGNNEVAVSSPKLEEYNKAHGIGSKNSPQLSEIETEE